MIIRSEGDLRFSSVDMSVLGACGAVLAVDQGWDYILLSVLNNKLISRLSVVMRILLLRVLLDSASIGFSEMRPLVDYVALRADDLRLMVDYLRLGVDYLMLWLRGDDLRLRMDDLVLWLMGDDLRLRMDDLVLWLMGDDLRLKTEGSINIQKLRPNRRLMKTLPLVNDLLLFNNGRSLIDDGWVNDLLLFDDGWVNNLRLFDIGYLSFLYNLWLFNEDRSFLR